MDETVTAERLQPLIYVILRLEKKIEALSGAWPEWMSLDVLSHYSGIPEETLWRYIKRKRNPLSCSQPGGRKGLVRVHRATFDQWMADQPRNEGLQSGSVEAMVEAAITSYQGKGHGAH